MTEFETQVIALLTQIRDAVGEPESDPGKSKRLAEDIAKTVEAAINAPPRRGW